MEGPDSLHTGVTLEVGKCQICDDEPRFVASWGDNRQCNRSVTESSNFRWPGRYPFSNR